MGRCGNKKERQTKKHEETLTQVGRYAVKGIILQRDTSTNRMTDNLRYKRVQAQNIFFSS